MHLEEDTGQLPIGQPQNALNRRLVKSSLSRVFHKKIVVKLIRRFRRNELNYSVLEKKFTNVVIRHVESCDCCTG